MKVKLFFMFLGSCVILFFLLKTGNLQSYYFTIEPPIYGDGAASGLAHGVSAKIGSQKALIVDVEFSIVKKWTTAILPTADIVSSGASSRAVIFFKIRTMRFFGVSNSTVKSAILNELDRIAKRAGDLGEATAWRDSPDGPPTVVFNKYIGKTLHFNEVNPTSQSTP